MATLHVLRVFVDEEGAWGNPLGVFLDPPRLAPDQRQWIAAELGFSETVFVIDREYGEVAIHTPAVELPFAGHPTVGTAWLLEREGTPVESLRSFAEEFPVRAEGEEGFVTADPIWAPDFEYVEHDSPAAVAALPVPPLGPGRANSYNWAWIDAEAGVVRTRAFVPTAGIPEDEATGSAAIALSARLGQPLTVRQGRGSLMRCRPLSVRLVELSGAVRLDEVRDHQLPERA